MAARQTFEMHCALGSGFADALRSGALDLAVHEVPNPNDRDEVLRKDHLVWMGSRDHDVASSDILPIAVFDRDCWWRDTALSALEDAGQRYRIVYTSESAVGVRAAVQAGIAAGLLSASDDAERLCLLPSISTRYPTYLVLQKSRGAEGPICEAMCTAIQRAFAE